MNSLAIIPARGGSKRIPRKNIKFFLGKPIIAYSILAAFESGLFEDIMVSTDDNEISQIANLFGASTPFRRSKENSSDIATTFNVVEEVLNYYLEQGKSFDNICVLYPCAPFITSRKLQEAFDIYKTGNYDSVIPIVRYGTPIQRALRIENEKIAFFHNGYEHSRSQDLETAYHDAGQFYWGCTKRILKTKSLFTLNTGYFILNELEVQDIDSQADWDLAELKYKLLKSKQNV